MRQDLTAAANGMHIKLGSIDGPPYLTLAEVAPVVRREVDVKPEATYTELGVRSFHKGTFHRRQLTGAEFTWQTLYRVDRGDLVFSNIMAWEGAVAMAGAEDHGCVGNHRMLTCVCDVTRVNPAFLARYFETPEGMAQLVAASTGTVARNRTLTTKSLERIQVPVPPLDLQHRVVAHFDALTAKTEQVEAHLDAAERDAEALVRAYVFSPPGEQPRMRRMSELLAQRQPDVAVDASANYRFAGVYSFGRGVFASAVKAGTDFAYERLSTVRAGDFIYPKLMAWEGALGVVPIECDGMVVSPEFPVFSVDTDVVLPEVLDVYFRSPQVWPALAELSGGTNVRRRRLQPTAFLNYEMPLPSMPAQIKACELFKRVKALKTERAAIRAANAALLPATLERIFRV